jgi:hypothetical protein
MRRSLLASRLVNERDHGESTTGSWSTRTQRLILVQRLIELPF